MAIQRAIRRFTVEEYHRLGEVGVLLPNERVELIDGEIVQISPIGPRHAYVVDVLNRLFMERLGDRVAVRVQNPVQTDAYSEPQPDLALLRPPLKTYARRHPRARHTFLVVEVADSSVDSDRDDKLPHYARTGVREAWLIDLPGQAVEVYRKPASGAYRSVRRLARGESLSLDAFPDVRFAVDDLLG
ncbi:MAG: Uma2 family endonuclease [Planctomycetes bacterium]|nr:Uma2 family endonuclease [Planctomycetota bacterium]